MCALPISVVIPTCNRLPQLQTTIRRILDCEPGPAEILVHIDAGDTETEPWLRRALPDVRVLQSSDRMGPGGGRNKLMAEAIHDIVASFDDDSFPIRPDYFVSLLSILGRFPSAAIVGATIVHRGETIPTEMGEGCLWAASFVGCGCAYRRSAFLGTAGYVPLKVAYNMEEVDLSLRMLDLGRGTLFAPELLVFHDTDFTRHGDPEITAYTIANIALFAYLRYPPAYWIKGVAQVFNRVLWLLKHKRFSGVLAGLAMIPRHIKQHRTYRATVKAITLQEFFRLRAGSRVAKSDPDKETD